MLILYLLRKLKKDSLLSRKIDQLKKFAVQLKTVFLLLVLTNTFANGGTKDNVSLVYNVVKSNMVIGTINISLETFGDSITYLLESDIKTKYVLDFKIKGKEKSVYRNGVLVYSSIYRTLNNTVKSNHSIKLKEGKYNLKKSNEFKMLDFKMIKRNLVTLYFKEPKGIKKIYCDNLNRFVDVIPLGEGRYKVVFSSGKQNIFHYRNGKCVKIEAVSKLFTVTLIPA